MPSQHGIDFQNRVDAVSDLGVNPDDDVIAASKFDSAPAGSLIEVPSGRYRVNGTIHPPQNGGIVAKGGDVTFVPPPGFNTVLFDAQGKDNILLKGFDIDITASNTTAGIRVISPNRFHIEDIEYVGRGTYPSPDVMYAFLLGVRNESGKGVVRNCRALKGSRPDQYKAGNGRVGIWGVPAKGTLKVQNCDFREFGNNGMYTSRTQMKVQVENSYFENNNVCGIRISGEGSYAKNCEIVIDIDRYSGPAMTNTGTGYNLRGIIVEQAKMSHSAGQMPIPAGALVEDCDILCKSSDLTQSVMEVGPQARSCTIKNTRIQVDADGPPAVRRAKPGSIPWRNNQNVPPKPHWIKVENCDLSGSSGGGPAVLVRDGDGSEVTNTEIDMPNKDVGVKMLNTANGTVRNCSINVGGPRVQGAGSRGIDGNANAQSPNITGNPSGAISASTANLSLSLPDLDKTSLIGLGSGALGYLLMRRRNL